MINNFSFYHHFQGTVKTNEDWILDWIWELEDRMFWTESHPHAGFVIFMNYNLRLKEMNTCKTHGV